MILSKYVTCMQLAIMHTFIYAYFYLLNLGQGAYADRSSDTWLTFKLTELLR